MGIVEMRETFKKLNQEYGITIIISSHILTELSMTATRYGIINDGKLIKELTNDELKEQCQRCIAIIVDDTAKAVTIIETALNTKKYKVINDKEIRIYDYLDNSAEVTFQLNSGGVRVSSLSEIGDNLEDYFISLVGEGK
jgi:ABC-2 type transport system ATP-binding protein